MTTVFRSVCPYCGKVNDLQTDMVPGRQCPDNGDLSICAGCLKVAVFDNTLDAGVRPPTPEEWVLFSQDPNLSRGLRNLEQARKLKNG